MSGNDAANALANAGGGVPETVAAMNATARELGALDTTAVNPSGLDAPRQFTSAYDLALIARAALPRRRLPVLRHDDQVQVPRQDADEEQAARAVRDLHAEQAGPQLRGAIGVKTGWTTKAKGTFVGAADPRRPHAGRGGHAHQAAPGGRSRRQAAQLGLRQRRHGRRCRHAESAGRDRPAEPESLPQRVVAVGRTPPRPSRSTAAVPWYSWMILGLAAAWPCSGRGCWCCARRRAPVRALWRQPAR